MKKILAICLTIIFALSMKAHNAVQPIEGDIYFGFNGSPDVYEDSEGTMGVGFGCEVRYNFSQLPVDVGGMFDVSVAMHDYGYKAVGPWLDTKTTVTIGAVGDWNFRQGKKVNPYIGTGLGLGLREGNSACAVFKPRVGVELLYHFRISFSAHVAGKGYSNYQLSIGATFGGRPKKR